MKASELRKFIEENPGQVVYCRSSWGMGVITAHDGEQTYGLPGGCDPHDFEPDYDGNTPAEIRAWKEAFLACKCGR